MQPDVVMTLNEISVRLQAAEPRGTSGARIVKW